MEVAHFKPSSPSHLGKQWPNLHLAPRLLHFSQALEGHSMAGRGLHGLHSWMDFLCLRIQQSLCLTLQEYWIQWSPVIRHVSPCILLWGNIPHFSSQLTRLAIGWDMPHTVGESACIKHLGLLISTEVAMFPGLPAIQFSIWWEGPGMKPQ